MFSLLLENGFRTAATTGCSTRGAFETRCTGAKDESSICINFNRFLFNQIRRSTVELCNWTESVGPVCNPWILIIVKCSYDFSACSVTWPSVNYAQVICNAKELCFYELVTGKQARNEVFLYIIKHIFLLFDVSFRNNKNPRNVFSEILNIIDIRLLYVMHSARTW